MARKVLVTGGAGFIGSNIVEELLKQGETVRVIDNFSTGKRENLRQFVNDIEIIEGDIRSYHIVEKAVKGTEVIFHQAALPSVPRSIIDPITTNEVNITGTLNILEAAKEANAARVVYASSSSVYGDNPELPKHEGMLTNPLSPYAVSKLAGEKYCAVFSKLYGLETVCLRYFNVFGPRQDPTSQYSAVIPKFITAIMREQPLVIYGDGEQSRDFTYISNVVEANLKAASVAGIMGRAVNCACHESITLNQLVSHLNAILGTSVVPQFSPVRGGDILHSFANIELAEKLIAYRPAVRFVEGLKRTVQHYKNLEKSKGS